ncbi:MAG: AAA family ATPase [Candidatus Saccharibacteria bacterium]|nr:AAA family ATPase [Candidatus Saccharibacteria bacterium]
MKDVKIIALVGMPGSGKGTCTDYLHEKYGYPVVHFGNMVYEEVQRRGLDNVKDEKFVREDMRKQEGSAVLAKHASKKADDYLANNLETVVFDGLYSWSEFKYLSKKYGSSLLVIAVAAPRQERYRRILDRHDSHRKYKSPDQIEERDIAEIENLEKGGPIAFADYTIVNDKTLDDMLIKLKSIIENQ